MEFLSKPRTWVVLGVSAVGLFLLYQLWVWEVERVEVPPNHFLVQISLWGKDLPEGEIVAPDEAYKGIQRRVLTEGRHFLNPILYSYERHKVVEVPKGSCAVLTRTAGTEIPADEKARGVFLAGGEFDEFAKHPPGQRGILERVLPAGKYYINPYEYSHQILPAVEVKADQVGVRVLKWGKDPKELTDLVARGRAALKQREAKGNGLPLPAKEAEAAARDWFQAEKVEPKLQAWLLARLLKEERGLYVVPEGYRGVQERYLPPMTYPINPYVEEIVPVGIRSHPVEFTDITFPSRDGFTIQPHVLVAYKVVPEAAPELFVQLCDHGQLPQGDATPEEQKKNPILQKFVLPLIRGYVRIEGSKYQARDYVSQQRDEKNEKAVNPRERLQKELMDKVAPACKQVGVIIETITVAQPEMNKDLEKLADAIARREQTRLEREKNKQLVEQHKQEQLQQAKEAEADQKEQVVKANTKLEQEKINAQKRKDVEQTKLEAALKAAQARLEGAKERAKATVTKGTGEAAIVTAKNEAEVAGLRTAVAGFPSPEQYAQYQVLLKVAPALSEIFASDQSEFAKVFTTYMTNGVKRAGLESTADAKKP